jgi:alkylation response protein AidB-like acyl-CoA dehydrogenase
MDFNYSPEDEAFRAEFRTWLELHRQYATPAREPLADESEDDWNARIRWHRELNEGGWIGLSWPREYGGRGATMLQSIIYEQELERAGTAIPYTGFGIPLLGPTLIHWGTEEQKRRHLPKILTAEEIWCQGYSEPNAGSDLASVQTRAVEDGDYFVVNGQNLDLFGAARRLDFFAHPYRHRGAETQGHHLPARGHEDARSDRASVGPDDRRARLQPEYFSRTSACPRQISSGRRTRDGRSRSPR